MDDNKLGAAGTTETGRLAGEDVEARPKRKSAVREYVEAIGVAVILALVIRALVVQAFTIPSGSKIGRAHV